MRQILRTENRNASAQVLVILRQKLVIKRQSTRLQP